MASLQTIAKGVYVIKPDMRATQAEDYVDLYNRARGQQLQMSMEAAAQEAKQKQLTFEQEMMTYRKQLELLAKQKQELLDQRATLSFNVDKYNADKRSQTQKLNAELVEDYKTKKAEQQVLSAGRVIQPGGDGTGGAAERLSPEEDAALKGIRSQAAASPMGNLTQALAETTSSQIAGTGPLAATSPGKAQRVRAGAVQEAINAKMQEGLSEDASIRAVAGDLQQLGAKGEEFIDAWDTLYGGKPAPTKPVVSGGSYQRPKFKGLQAPEELAPEQISGEETAAMIDRELAGLQAQMDNLGIPRLEQTDLLERARQIREERFKGSVVSEAQKKQKAKAAESDLASMFESTPQGYIASRVEGGRKLISSPDELSGLLGTEEGSIVESIYAGNATTSKTTEEAMKKTWDEISSMLSSDPSKMRKSHELLIALNERALASKNPSKAIEIENISVAPEQVIETETTAPVRSEQFQKSMKALEPLMNREPLITR